MSSLVSIDDSIAIGLIPARGGSKSIPLKNLVPLSGRPLITYVIAAGQNSNSLAAVYCSTDHKAIAKVCRNSGVEVIERPAFLGEDDTPVISVIVHALETLGQRHGSIPGIVALLQPTSPFVLPAHVDACVAALRVRPDADSAQTITPVTHNAHAFNQRIVENGIVRFRYPEDRRIAYNKQRKPKHFVFGNLVVSRSKALLSGKDCFGDLSLPVDIPGIYSLDVDTAEDLHYANYLISVKGLLPDVGPTVT